MKILYVQFLSAVVAMFIASPSFADSPNIDLTSTGVTSSDISTVERLATIRELIHLGIKENDALPLITAARLMRSLPGTSVTRAHKIGSTTDNKVESVEVFNNSVTGILKRAERMANGKRSLVSLIKEVRAMPKMRVGGTMHLYKVAAKSTDEFEITFEPNHRAAIFVESQEDNGLLSIIVRDESDNVICQNNRKRAHVHCAWTPLRKGQFKFKVENSLDKPQDYILVTN